MTESFSSKIPNDNVFVILDADDLPQQLDQWRIYHLLYDPGDGLGLYYSPDNASLVKITGTGGVLPTGTVDDSLLRWNDSLLVWSEFTEYILPLVDGQSGEVMVTDSFGTVTWQAPGHTLPAGNNEEIQYNDNGVFGADPHLIWDASQDSVIVDARDAGERDGAFEVERIQENAVGLKVQSINGNTTFHNVWQDYDPNGENSWKLRVDSTSGRQLAWIDDPDDIFIEFDAIGDGQIRFGGSDPDEQMFWDWDDNIVAIRNGSTLYFEEITAANPEIIAHGQIWVMEGTGGDTFWTEVENSSDMEGLDGATTYTEVSLNAASATFHGGAELDTAQFQSGTSSLLLTRSTSDFISFPDIAAYDFGTDEWTVEGYARFASLPAIDVTTAPGYCLFAIWDDAGVEQIRYVIIVDAFGTRVKLEGNGGWAEQGTISGGITLGVWYHWAISRDSGGVIRAYFNGVYETQDFGSAPADMGGSAAPIRIGQSDGIGRTDFFDGWIDNVRMTIGTARYTGTGGFTPPATPFPTAGAGPNTFYFTDNDGTDFLLNTSNVLPVGTITDALLRWDGSEWVESTEVLISSSGDLTMEGGSIYMEEVGVASADVATFGQFWVRDDAPNVPMFTDDTGVDYVLNADVVQTPWLSDIDGDGFDLNDAGVIFLREQTIANVDVAGQGQFWVRDDVPNVPMFTDDDGNDHNLLESTGGSSVIAPYRFDNSIVEADPGTGDFRMDNATPASVTELFISNITDNGSDFQNLLSFVSAGDQIYIQQDNDSTKYIFVDVTANVDNGGWFSIACTVNNSGTIFDNNGKCHILILFGGSGSFGDVFKVGTPVNNQIGVWTGDGTIEGTTGLTYDGNTMYVNSEILFEEVAVPVATPTSTQAILFLKNENPTELRWVDSDNVIHPVGDIYQANAPAPTDAVGVFVLGGIQMEGTDQLIFDGQNLTLTESFMSLTYIDTGASANEGIWSIQAYSEIFEIVLYRDSFAAFSVAFGVSRTNWFIDEIFIGGPIKLDGTYLEVGDGAASFIMFQDIDSQFIGISGGVLNDGGNILLYGSNETLRPGDVRLRSDFDDFMIWDESVGDLEILSGIGSKTSALTVTVDQSVQPVSFKLPTATDTELDDITDAINTSPRKEQGTVVYNTTTDNPVYATGNTDGAVWVDGAGTTVNTPV